MKTKSIQYKLTYIGSVVLSVFFMLMIITFSWIGYEIKHQCQLAIQEYGGDCVEASITLLDDEQKDFRSRNNAIWVLGQLGSSQALPTLNKYYTGNIPPREPLSKTISQYELKKAINLVSGGTNISALFWRHSGILN